MTLEELLEDYHIKETELREKIAQVINDSNLPAIITEPVLRDFYEQIHNQKEQQTRNAYINKEKRKQEKENKDKKASK